MRIVVVDHVTLDGVMRGPGRADVLGHWNAQGSPFRDALSNAPKYVASNTLAEPLPWPHSTLLSGDIPAAVADAAPTAGGVIVGYRPPRKVEHGSAGSGARRATAR